MSPMAILFISFVITLAIGVPIVWAISLSSIFAILAMGDVPLTFLAQRMYAGTEKYALLAVFFFMLAGAIMQHGGISSRLIKFCKAAFGHVSGGLSIVALVACIFFAALSGSSIATTAAIGAILYPELVKAGYPKGYSGVLPVVGGTLGIVIPPSIVFVVYGTATNTSVSKLLMSGLMPGVLAGVAMCIYAYVYAKKNNLPKGERFNLKNFVVATRDAFWALLMPIIILGGIYSGVFTATESAAVAVVYGLIVSIFIYRELKFDKLIQIAIDSVQSTANVMLILMAASLFAWVLTRNNVPTILANAMTGVITNKVTFLLCLNVLLLILGMIMDAGPIILIVAPLVYPIAMSYGIDPIQLGCIIVFNLSVGQATPPFGNCLFAAVPVTNQDVITLSKNAVPFIVILYAMVLLTSFVPALSTWIPSMMSL